jgi:hypothetical protein
MSGLEIDIDTEALSKRIGDMLEKINHFKRVDIGMGLSEWQTEELHRHRPFTMRSRAKGLAVTKIRPHSLFEMERSAHAAEQVVRYRRALAMAAAKAYAGKRVRKYRRRHRHQRFYRHTSTRPILREEALEVLMIEMANLLEAKIKW